MDGIGCWKFAEKYHCGDENRMKPVAHPGFPELSLSSTDNFERVTHVPDTSKPSCFSGCTGMVTSSSTVVRGRLCAGNWIWRIKVVTIYAPPNVQTRIFRVVFWHRIQHERRVINPTIGRMPLGIHPAKGAIGCVRALRLFRLKPDSPLAHIYYTASSGWQRLFREAVHPRSAAEDATRTHVENHQASKLFQPNAGVSSSSFHPR